MSNGSFKHDPESWKRASGAYAEAADKMARLKGRVASTGKAGVGGPAQVDMALQQVLPHVPDNIDRAIEGLAAGLKSDSLAMTKTLKTYRDTEEGQRGIVVKQMFDAGRDVVTKGIGAVAGNPQLLQAGQKLISDVTKGIR